MHSHIHTNILTYIQFYPVHSDNTYLKKVTGQPVNRNS